ncbi:NAD kinase [Amnibacterium flavum]|uniref:NAD kinase n=1 Tax=Amnibacterium flavum TaxID=2173173 RepID=A0A2V1HX35_9MICO|nr:NAD kinase [Amnibacterium flavum]PVZ94824.1 NAD kinase [Amnibacterium flavum]
MTASPRHMLVVSHTGRQESLDAACEVISLLGEAGVTPVLNAAERDDLLAYAPRLDGLALLDEVDPESLELVIVLGGDGTILRAAEMVRGSTVPLLGVNLGHVGFLAEAERDDLGETLRRALARDYVVEERMTIDVRVLLDGETVYQSWALNEATVEKASRERMLELIIEVGGRPLSAFGCDGAVIATPTGSTAYAFSAGGPVVWPNIDAILMVPLAAHALFARPLVVAPTSMLAIEVQRRNNGTGVLFCDGRRTHELPPGARVEATKSATPVRLARLQRGVFTDRLVRKFDLPVAGWRGPADR